jgi:hypothetical protein
MPIKLERPSTAFLRVQPLEIVFQFDKAGDAKNFGATLKEAQLDDKIDTWVRLSIPEGLVRVYTTRKGDIGFEFNNKHHAEKWAQHLANLGNTFESKPKMVYIGRHLVH